MIRRPPRTTRTDTLFPYTTRFRSGVNDVAFTVPLVSLIEVVGELSAEAECAECPPDGLRFRLLDVVPEILGRLAAVASRPVLDESIRVDRKSTRLNSSH